MKLINLQSLGHALLLIGAFALAGTVTAERSDALPIVTSNGAEFKNDFSIGGGLDALSKERKTVTPSTIGVFSYRADSPRLPGDTVITAPTETNHGTYGYVGVAKRDNADAIIRTPVSSKVKTDRPFQTEGYFKGSARLGSDTAISGIYYRESPAAELALRNGNLAVGAGYQFGDRSSVTGSIAYSIGKLSPFASYRDKAMHYGAEYKIGDNLAVQGAYRPDENQYSIGFNLALGSSAAKAPLQCGGGYSYNAAADTCAKKIEAPSRVEPAIAPIPPDTDVIRGRG